MNHYISKNFLKIFILVTFVTSPFAVGQENSVIKIAVLDMGTALFNSEQARMIDEEVRVETETDQQKIRDLAQEAQELQEELQQNAAVMSEDEQRKKNEDIQELAVQYEFLVQRLETYVQQKREEFQQTYAPNLIQAISEIVEEKEYDIVLRSEAVIDFADSHNITAEVTARLNQQ